jgi:hypothetical protein
VSQSGQTNYRRYLVTLLSAVFLAVGLLPSPAAAQSSNDLTRYVPAKTQLLIGLNINKLTSSKYYEQALNWARANSQDDDFFEVLEEDANLDLSKDLTAMVISIPDAKADPAKQERTFTMAASGSFDKDELVEAVKEKHDNIKETKRGKQTVYTAGEFEFTFPAKGVLWVSAGPEAYRKGAWKAATNKKHSVQSNSLIKGLLGDIDASRGFWMVGDTSWIDPQAAQGGPQPESIGLSVDISKGLVLDLLSDMPSAEEAKGAAKQLDELKQTSGKNPMLSMLGVTPLVKNLSVSQDGARINIATRMTASEFDVMIQRVTQMAQSQMQGGGPGNAPSQPVPNEKSPSKDGSNADFN